MCFIFVEFQRCYHGHVTYILQKHQHQSEQQCPSKNTDRHKLDVSVRKRMLFSAERKGKRNKGTENEIEPTDKMEIEHVALQNTIDYP